MQFERKMGRGHGEIVDVGFLEAKRLLAENWLPLRADGSYAVVAAVSGSPRTVDGKTIEEIFGLPPALVVVSRARRPWAALAVLVGVYLLGRRG